MKNLKLSTLSVAALTLGLVASTASAQNAFTNTTDFLGSKFPTYQSGNQMVSVTPSIGTLGYGLEASYKLRSDLSVRGAYRTMGYDTDFEIEGEDFAVGLDATTAGIMFDHHPFGSAFRISGGILNNRSEANLNGSYNGSFTFNGNTYTDPNPTVVTGRVSFPSVAPAVTFGWDKKIGDNFAMSAEFGAMYIGRGSIDLTATGGAANQPSFQNELENERARLEDQLQDYRFYPIMQFGASLVF
jgi:hypothetical protein